MTAHQIKQPLSASQVAVFLCAQHPRRSWRWHGCASGRQLWAARNKGWVNHAELAEANALLERLCELLSRPRDPSRDRPMSLAFVLAPAAVRGGAGCPGAEGKVAWRLAIGGIAKMCAPPSPFRR
ncbi:hypothetical protein [Xanthomonas graminis]|uniref:hypothetical protein n=1 Tax=Xanthomonas graminis TaxID=3390026 RepID=UPI001F324FD0|nr:hypothetical protein [Xanthomonas translucens]UKE72448.1 hypothetical protein KFS85_15525 [Xanthomonas translucens pv. phleipratensis]